MTTNNEKIEKPKSASPAVKASAKSTGAKGEMTIKGRTNGKLNWQANASGDKADISFVAPKPNAQKVSGTVKFGAESLVLSVKPDQEIKGLEGVLVNITISLNTDTSGNGVLVASFPFDGDTEYKWVVSRWVLSDKKNEEVSKG